MTDPRTLIAARRREIEAEIARLNSHIDALRAELPELEVAERVYGRLAGNGGPQAGQAVELAPPLPPEEDPGLSKPPNTPTIPAMIVASLQDALTRGKAGLEPRQMTDFIAAKWWPNAPSVAISPIAWRMWKRGDLRKRESVYMLPRNTEAADLLSNAGSAASNSNQH